MAKIRWNNRAVTAITPHAGNRRVLIPPYKGTSTPPAVPDWTTDPPAVPDGDEGVAYSYNLAADLNTTIGVAITVTAGALPPGLSISGTSIVGTPTIPGTFSGIQLTASNVSGSDESLPFDIDIAGIPVPTAVRFDNPVQGGKEVLDQGTEVFSGGTGLRPEYQALIDGGAPVFVVDFDNGDNGNSGTEASPWRTFAYALDNLPTSAILLVRGDDQVNTEWLHSGTSFTNGVIQLRNGGANAANPSVICNEPGRTPRVIHSPVSGAPNGKMIATQGVSNVWFDGITFDKDGNNGDIFHVGTTSRDCRVRHCTFQNVNLIGTPSNDAAIIMETSIGGSHRRDNIIEYCRIQGITGTGDKNCAGILLYDNHGGIVRWNDIDIGSAGDADIFEKVGGKLELYNQPQQYYRNALRSNGFIASLSSTESSPYTMSHDFYENFLSGKGMLIGARNPESGSVVYSKAVNNSYYHNTVINASSLFGYYTQERSQWGGIISGRDNRITGISMYNNLGETNGTASFRTSHDIDALGPYPHGQWNAAGRPDYNGYAPADGVFTAFYRIPGPGDDYTETLAEWQAHGYDLNSTVSTGPVDFIDRNNDDYRLSGTSPHSGAGIGGNDQGAFWQENWLPQVGPEPM